MNEWEIPWDHLPLTRADTPERLAQTLIAVSNWLSGQLFMIAIVVFAVAVLGVVLLLGIGRTDRHRALSKLVRLAVIFGVLAVTATGGLLAILLALVRSLDQPP